MVHGVDIGSAGGIAAGDGTSDGGVGPHAVARIGSAAGPATVQRPDGNRIIAAAGCLLHTGDVVETGPCGAVGIVFRDGMAFQLSAEGRLSLDDFRCKADGTLQSGLINLFKGPFAFVAGALARAGKLRIDTPFGVVRGPVPFGGIGLLSFAAFTFALLKEAQAADPDIAFLAEGQGQLSDMEHGPVEVLTKGPNPEIVVIDNPEISYILTPQGSGVGVASVVNSAQQIADYLAASKEAFQSYVTGRADPFVQQQQRADLQGITATSAGGGGSSTLFSDTHLAATTGFAPPTGQPQPTSNPGNTPAPGAFGAPQTFFDPPLPPPPVDTTPTKATPFTVIEAGVQLGGDAPAPGDPTTSGTLGSGVTVIDVNGLPSNVGHAVAGIYGSITVASDGSYVYTLDNTIPATNALPAGSAVPDTFTLTLSTGVIEPLTITVFGNNDIPHAAADSDAVIEAGVQPCGNIAVCRQTDCHRQRAGQRHRPGYRRCPSRGGGRRPYRGRWRCGHRDLWLGDDPGRRQSMSTLSTTPLPPPTRWPGRDRDRRVPIHGQRRARRHFRRNFDNHRHRHQRRPNHRRRRHDGGDPGIQRTAATRHRPIRPTDIDRPAFPARINFRDVDLTDTHQSRQSAPIFVSAVWRSRTTLATGRPDGRPVTLASDRDRQHRHRCRLDGLAYSVARTRRSTSSPKARC